MLNGSVSSLIPELLIVGWVLYRQTAKRPVKENLRLFVVLAVIGVVEVNGFISSKHNMVHHHPVVRLVDTCLLALPSG